MSEKDRMDALLQGAFRPHEPGRGLKAKILSRPHVVIRRPVWAACGLAGLAIATVTVVILMPQASLADTVKQELNAFNGHVAMYRVLSNGRWKRIGDEWSDGSKDRTEDRSEDGVYWLHDPSKGYQIMWDPRNGMIRFLGAKPGTRPLPNIVTTQSLQAFFNNRGAKPDISVQRVEFGGRAADCVYFKWGGRWNTKFYAEPNTHRLLGWSSVSWRRGPGTPEERLETLFVVDSTPIPPHIFDPIFKVAGKPVNLVVDKEEWQKRLAKPLAVNSVELLPRTIGEPLHQQKTIEMRDVSVNPAGDVFVLFTGVNGAYGTNVVPATIRDATGGVYRRAGGLRATENGEGFSFDGKPLEAAWFVRIRGGAVKGPVSVGFKQEFEPLTHLAFSYTGEPDRLTTDVPLYMPFMSMPIGTSEDWLKSRTLECADERRDAKDYRAEESLLRKRLAMEITPEDKRLQNGFLDLRLATCLERQGRRAEAYTEYQRADRAERLSDFTEGQYMKEAISGGLNRLNPGR